VTSYFSYNIVQTTHVLSAILIWYPTADKQNLFTPSFQHGVTDPCRW